MNLEDLKQLLRKKGATEFLYKKLSDNDNSKQQIYLGGSYEALQSLPIGKIYAEAGTKRPTFKSTLKMSWLSDDGRICPAPNAKLILYPKYPEIRLSGFLSGCANAPNKYLQPKTSYERTGSYDGRVLVLCPIKDNIIAYLAISGSSISNYLSKKIYTGVFGKEPISHINSKKELILTLKKAYQENPHEKVRLFPDGIIRPYDKKNAAGYTLEAQFGIIPNGSPNPDYNGWELKCHKDNTITLMTPQPNGGLYAELGNREFVNRYGHVAEDGGKYFTGPYYCKPSDKFPNRRIHVTGFNPDEGKEGKITDSSGAIYLMEGDIELASWSFAHILSHWNQKHNKACYVEYKNYVEYGKPITKIEFLPNILLCEGTSAIKLIKAILNNLVYYDPGSKVSANGDQKSRSQFRVKFDNLNQLYISSQSYNLAD